MPTQATVTPEQIEEAVSHYLSSHGGGRMSLRAAMFDMDGVLFDSMRNHARAWHETMVHFGMNMSEQEAYMHEGSTGSDTINLVSMRERGRAATDEEIETIYAYKCRLFRQCPEPRPMPGASELLLKVKVSGITPILVTGSGQRSLLDRLDRAFPGIFIPELMVTALDVTHGKPYPEPYLKGMEKIRRHTSQPALDEKSFIVIENAPLGVQAGVAAGVFTVAVNTGPLPDRALLDAGANLLYHSMQELCDGWETLLAHLRG